MTLRPLFRRLRAFLQSVPARAYGSHMPEPNDGITRLSALAPTVKPEETARLYRNRKAVDFERLPV